MGDLLHFPNFDEEWRRSMGEAIRGALREDGYGAEVADWIFAEWETRLKVCFPTWETPDFHFDLPQGYRETGEYIRKAILSQQQWGKELTLNLAAQLLRAVVELSAAQFAISKPTEKTKAQILKLVPATLSAIDEPTHEKD